MKTFNTVIIGTSGRNKTSVRFSNNWEQRKCKLIKTEFTNIHFWSLPNPMSKKDAIRYVLSNNQLSVEHVTLLQKTLRKYVVENISVMDILSTVKDF